MRMMAAAIVVSLIAMIPDASSARTRTPIQTRSTTSSASQAPPTWEQVVREMSRLEGNDAEAAALLQRFLKTNPRRFEPYIALAHIFEKQARFAEAADTVRAARKAVPDMPAMFVLQLAQYDIQQVTESPALPVADAARVIKEAIAVCDQLIAAKQEVRLAMMAKSLALQKQSERVEQTAARKQAVMAESDSISQKARFTNADGSTIAKTVDDEWLDLQGTFFVGSAAAPTPDGAKLEKFAAAHPDFVPVRLALGRYYTDLGDAIKDPAPKSAAARTQNFQAADAHLTRAIAIAHDPVDAMLAISARIDLLGADRLNRPAEGEALARSAIAKYPDQPALVMSLARLLLPPGKIATDAAVRSLRQAAAATPESQHTVGIYLWQIVSSNKDLARPAAAKLLSEAMASFDAALKMRPTYVEALVYKAVTLRLQAERVETEPARIKALKAEADRLSAQAKELQAKQKG